MTFDAGLSAYTPAEFPLEDGVKMVAPFWTDVDTTANSGLVYYRQTTDPGLLDTGSSQIKLYFSDMQSFKATWMFIATWWNVTFFGGNEKSPVSFGHCALVYGHCYCHFLFLD